MSARERVEEAERMVIEWSDRLDAARHDLCVEEGHDWRRWVYGKYPGDGAYMKVRVCDRCGDDEAEEVTREEYNLPR